jgi:hypothetical protein
MNPLAIYQRALDAVSNAVLAGDFARYSAMIDLPYLIHTETARLLAASYADLRATFEVVSGGLRSRGVTHYERVARAADYVHRDRIEGWHHTHLLAEGERIACPHTSRHAIVRRGDVWLFSEAHYAIKADHWPLDEATIFAEVSFPSRSEAAG